MTKKKSVHVDVAIIGGGVPGLVLAGLLAHAGISVRIIDPQPPADATKLKPSSRTVALLNNSLNILAAAGLQDPARYGAPLQTMRLVDDSHPKARVIKVDFRAEDLSETQYGTNIPLNILRARLATLHRKMMRITTLKSFTVQAHSVQLALSDGLQIHAKLVVGADGRKSLIREKSDIPLWKHDYHQSALTFIINHSRPHHNIATEFHRCGGPLALVPLPGKQSSVVWVMPTDEAERTLRLKKSDFESAFQKALGQHMGQVTLVDTPACWPLILLKAKCLTAPRIALIAESAHVISPITAQGLNLSLRDAAALAESIITHVRLGLDAGDPAVLRGYENARRLDLNTRIYGVHSLHQMVSTQSPALRSVRRGGLQLINGIGPLKKMAMKAGLG
ncbi:MAG: FAD-dependent monooxygenase [Alphaproteobacteria bacterium]|nr:FAD-dependent monooxygenase [Alphaproteobacteria bacterium]